MSAVHYFRLDDAAKYGLTEAVMLQNFRHWIGHNQANGKHQHDGKTWTYNSVKAFGTMFPYLTTNQIRRCIESLITQGVLVRGNYNESAYDKTSWFAFSSESFSLVDLSNLPNGKGVSATSHTNNKPMENADIGAAAPLPPAKLPSCPHRILIDLFGKHLPTMPQPKPELWSGAKADAMSARWKWVMTATKSSGARYAATHDEALNFFERFFAYVGKSDFLTGRNEKWTRCNLSWLMKADNFAKVLEGHYENESAA